MIRFHPTLAALAVAAVAFGPAPAAAAPLELTLWHMEQPPHRVARLQELIDEFNAEHPEIELTQEPQNWGEIYAKAPAALAAGIGPDLLFAIPDFTPVLKDIGALESVEDFVDELDAEHDFVDSAVAAYRYDDGVWAVPLYNMALSLWYRPSVLEAAGVEVPTTWEEWLAAAEALSDEDTYGMGLPANRQLYTDQAVYAVLLNGGAAEFYNADGTLRFDNEDTVAGLDFYARLHEYSPPDSPSWTWGEAEACFSSGSCAMVPQFTVITTYDTQAEGDPDDLAAAAIPVREAGTEPGTIAYANAVMLLSNDAAKRDAAETFVAWLLEPEHYGRFLNMEPGLFLPVTADGMEAESYWSDPLATKYRSQIETMIENAQNGMLFGFTGAGTFPSIAAISAQNLVADAAQRVIVEGEDPATAAAQGQGRMEEAAN